MDGAEDVPGRNRPASRPTWRRLERRVLACERCPRLRDHCRDVARVRRRAYRDQVYWGRPVPSFGDKRGRILILGLAPAAHGANRTGRMFTGDRSGDWLYAALHRAGLANQAESIAAGDGLRLKDAFVSAVCRCAPPENRPTRDEMACCAPYLDDEFDLMKSMRVTLALGKIAWDAAFRRALSVAPQSVPRPRPPFGHGAETLLSLRRGVLPIWLLASYHPSQQNTLTGRLTRPMFERVIRRAVDLANGAPAAS